MEAIIKIMNNLRVYVIELEQPFINWYGQLKSYYPSSNFCEVEDDDGNIHKVGCSEVMDSDNNKNIKDVII